jgi:hypothetical protein
MALRVSPSRLVNASGSVPCVDGSGTPTTSSSPDGTGRGDALGARSAVPATGVDPDDAEAPLGVTDEG